MQKIPNRDKIALPSDGSRVEVIEFLGEAVEAFLAVLVFTALAFLIARGFNFSLDSVLIRLLLVAFCYKGLFKRLLRVIK